MALKKNFLKHLRKGRSAPISWGGEVSVPHVLAIWRAEVLRPPSQPWFVRLGKKLWPARHCDPPMTDPGETFNDCVVTTITCVSPFIARLQFLLSGRMRVSVKTLTENVAGNTKTNSTAWVSAPKWMEPK